MIGKIKSHHWIISFGVILGFNLLYSQFQSPVEGVAPNALLIANVITGFIALIIVNFIINGFRKYLGLDQSVKKRTSTLYALLVFYGLYILLRITGAYQNKKVHFVNQCIQTMELRAETEPYLNEYDLKAYCECVMEKTMKLEVRDTSWMGDVSSTRAKELYGQCLSNSKNPPVHARDALSGPADTLSVINLVNQIQVKVSINGKPVYLIFDSGASDVILSSEFVSGLDSSLLDRTGEKSSYQLVDGSSLETEIVRVGEFEIGRFTFHDMEVSVAQDIPHSLLGKSLLDRFSEWTITSNNQLILKP